LGPETLAARRAVAAEKERVKQAEMRRLHEENSYLSQRLRGTGQYKR
jgi:hypothetical protein